MIPMLFLLMAMAAACFGFGTYELKAGKADAGAALIAFGVVSFMSFLVELLVMQ